MAEGVNPEVVLTMTEDHLNVLIDRRVRKALDDHSASEKLWNEWAYAVLDALLPMKEFGSKGSGRLVDLMKSLQREKREPVNTISEACKGRPGEVWSDETCEALAQEWIDGGMTGMIGTVADTERVREIVKRKRRELREASDDNSVRTSCEVSRKIHFAGVGELLMTGDAAAIAIVQDLLDKRAIDLLERRNWIEYE